MSLGSIVLLTVVWLAMSKVLTCESLRNSGSHRGRHKYKRRQLYSGGNIGDLRLHRDDLPLQHDPSLLLMDDDNEAATDDSTFELDKPLPIDQVAVPVGGKAYLPCDTRNQDPRKYKVSSGFFMVMWFKEQKENNPEDQSYGQAAPSSSSILSTSGEPIFTYDTRQTSAKVPNPPRWWSSPMGFGDRAYFHTLNSEQLQSDQDTVDHLTVDRAMATDTGIYRCRIDFLQAPTRNRLVNLTVIVAPERPTIYFEYGNSIGGDRPENYQQNSGNVIVVDEGSLTVTLVCRVVGGWPRPRLTWYHENAVLHSPYQLVIDDNHSRGYRKKPNNGSTTAGVTVNRLVLTNLTRWHPIMSQRQQTLGTARLTCQASNSILYSVSRPSAIAVNGNLPPPATTEHTFIRLNLKPTEVQIISIKGYANHLKSNESHVIEKNEVFASEDTVGHKKYTIRADRVYQAECRSKGSRPLATIEWYLLKKNQRFNVGQSINSTRTMDASSLMVLLGEKRGGATANLESTISGVVETHQTPEIVTDKDELVVTTSILSFILWGPKSAVINENDDNESTLVCHAYNPVIKTFDRHYVETKITLDAQYPPIVELRFGNRMLDTGRIGPGDDVYFECAARANPSTTIRYSWYHNGVRLTQETEKRRTDDGEKRGEKRNSRLAGRVIQYSQLGSLVLQSVNTAAAGKYSCQATNGIDGDTNENRTTSNTVRLYVKHVPVCQHREDIYIITKKTDAVTGPVIRCRAGHGHPPTIEYHWKFYPEQSEPETRHRGPLESNEMTLTGRSIRELDSLLTESAVQGSDGGISYAFTTSTPVLKSYLSVVSAAASAFSSAVRPNFLHGRLECRAVNTMGIQNKPCVYRITDKTMINQGSKDLQEITDCRSISKKELSNEDSNSTLTYPCGAKVEGIVTSTNRRTRFCITCSLNTSSLQYHQQRPNYVLQLFKSTPGDAPATVVIAFNVTGVTITENNNGNGRTIISAQDDDDYYSDPEEEDDVVDSNKGDYNLDTKNAVQRVVFVIDDSVEPGIYRGRIYNGYGGTISAVIKGMINVAAVPFNDINDNDSSNYIIDDIGDKTDESALGYAWRRVTVALVDAFSLVLPPSAAGPEPDWDEDRARPPHKRWRATSAALTAVLVAVVAALSCGICGVVAILYRRQNYGHRRGDRGHVAYGLGCDGGGVDSADGDDAQEGTGKTVIVGRLKATDAAPPATDVDGARQQHHNQQQQQQRLLQQRQQQQQQQQRQRQLQQQQQQQQRQRRLQQTPIAASDDARSGACTPLLHVQPLSRRVQYASRPEAAGRPLSATFPVSYAPDDDYDDDDYDATALRLRATDTSTVNCNAATVDRRDDGRGPDVVMSTATTLHLADTVEELNRLLDYFENEDLSYVRS
ncbi:uncharacterized protein LOC100167149 isoform X2 [Acyrthosiphon pisum]|uniref:Ig-like domain-containing protein n=1 Tax=Acyrthosiphon pisum TaxID=7029 RepID=A0A8R2NM67_ACYPI|nr:uncharacterized protein LOC100167149 isoform X2 [Acyrthosiphon pisum]